MYLFVSRQAAGGDLALLEQAMKAANETSSKVGKLFLSHNSQQLALICFVPEVLVFCLVGFNIGLSVKIFSWKEGL